MVGALCSDLEGALCSGQVGAVSSDLEGALWVKFPKKHRVKINSISNSIMKIKILIFSSISFIIFLLGCGSSQSNSKQQSLIKSKTSHTYCDNLDTALAFPNEVVNLYIRGIGVDSLPINFSQMDKLKKISIASCKKLNFTILFRNMSKINTITELEIRECNIGKLPSDIGKITSLKNLLLTHDSIKELPAQIGDLTNLEGLYLYDNGLSFFPILKKNDLKNIREIKLSQNKFKEIPESLFTLLSLQSLSVEQNQIEKVSNNLKKLTNLKILDIGDNPISKNAIENFKRKKNYGEMGKIFELMPNCKINLFITPQ